MTRIAGTVVLGLLWTLSAPADPLRSVPSNAQLAVIVENPRKLVETVRQHEVYQSAQSLPQVREALTSTTALRFFQFIAYYERELGTPWPQLLDQIAGRGVVLASFQLEDNGPTLLVAEGTDEATVQEFVQLATKLLEAELTRQAVKGQPTPMIRKSKHAGAETMHLGEEFHAARRGSTIYLSNRESTLKASLDQAAGAGKTSLAGRSEPQAARKLLGGDPLAWLWFDLAQAKSTKAAQDYFESVKKDAFQTFVLGSTIDTFRRSHFLSAGLWATPTGLRAAIRLPARRVDVPKELALHIPAAGTPGSLPLLEPKGVLYSQSFHLDLGTFWKTRKQVLNEQQLKDVEQAEKDISKVLPGTTLGQLLEMSGPYHRLVSVAMDETPYQVRPDQLIPPVALVSSMRQPQFGKSIASALRAAGFLASFSTGVTMSEETYEGIPIVSYRFPENRSLEADPGNLRFNFVPSFAVVGDSLVVSSRPSLVKRLIPELRATPRASSPAVWRNRIYAPGVAEVVRLFPDPIITQTILNQGVGLDEAKNQVEQLTRWLSTIGSLSLELDHQPEAFQIQFEWASKK